MLIAINVSDRNFKPGIVALDIAPVAERRARVGVDFDTPKPSWVERGSASHDATDGHGERSSSVASVTSMVLVAVGLFACAVVLAAALLEFGV